MKVHTSPAWISRSMGVWRRSDPGADASRTLVLPRVRRNIMSYAIVGFGKIGQALAHAFARKNIDVTDASRRLPEALAPQARAIGPTVVAKSLRGCTRGRHNHLGGPVRGTSRGCEGPAEMERQDGHRRDERVSST